jgi:hypothetical protein
VLSHAIALPVILVIPGVLRRGQDFGVL